MARKDLEFRPPHCPNPVCKHHGNPCGWRFKKKGFFSRKCSPHRIQRYLCFRCGVSFSSQSFLPSYWLKRADLLPLFFHRILSCSGYRQIAREIDASPTTVLGQIRRLGRHCLLFHESLRPPCPPEPLVVDGFESFEFSQYTPVHFHTAVGSHSHFWYGFTDSELRRKGRMTPQQKKKRLVLEQRYGRPDPKSVEREMAELIRILVPPGSRIQILSDEHPAYPRAWNRLKDRQIDHLVTSSRIPRTSHNPLFPANLLDLLIRHGSANHKRETIAFSKRRQSAAERLAILLVWRNYVKPFSEKKGGDTPAQRLGITSRSYNIPQILTRRLFPSLIQLPERLARYYRREIHTRRIPHEHHHNLRYAF